MSIPTIIGAVCGASKRISACSIISLSIRGSRSDIEELNHRYFQISSFGADTIDEMDLTLKKCIPCEGGDPPLLRAEVEKFILEIKGWSLSENGILKIKQEFKFGDFASALLFVNKVGEIAEGEGHHPDICFGWGKVEITLYTHAVGGLSENDFIMAAKINQLQTK